MVIKQTNGTKKSGSRQNKAAFVRSLPTDLPAKEVVDRAKAVGLSFSDKYVYNIRHSAKVAAKETKGASGPKAAKSSVTARPAPAARSSAPGPVAKRPVGRPRGSRSAAVVKMASPALAPAPRPATHVATHAAPHATSHATGSQIEELLRAAAAELGLGRAISILESERAKVRAVFRA